jgi:mono/diheme cytochrome c family protein
MGPDNKETMNLTKTKHPDTSRTINMMLIALFLTVGSLVLYGCGSSQDQGAGDHDESESAEHAEAESDDGMAMDMDMDGDHDEGAEADHDEGATADHDDGPNPDHSHMEGMADEHMSRMAEFREVLQKNLGDDYAAVIAPATAEQIAQGREVYLRTCAVCHGPGGKGDGAAGAALTPPPADFTDAEHASFYSDRARLEIIRKGSPGTAMVAWENVLKEDEVLAVFEYIRSLRPSS